VLVPPHDDGALAQAILRVLGDRDLAARLAAGGRARVETEFSVDRLISETVRVYSERLVALQARTGP
jgi:glycosyltransferase involved in cell wall biosynthesis